MILIGSQSLRITGLDSSLGLRVVGGSQVVLVVKNLSANAGDIRGFAHLSKKGSAMGKDPEEEQIPVGVQLHHCWAPERNTASLINCSPKQKFKKKGSSIWSATNCSS